MSVILSTANAILKEDYLGPLRSALNVATPVLDRLHKNTRDIVGKEAWIPVEMALNQGGGARAESAVLPAAGKGDYKELKVALKYYYGAMLCSGPVIRQTSKGERGSFGRIVDIEAKGIKKTLQLILAHDMYLGHKLAACGTTTASTTVQLETDANMEFFEKNMVVDIVLAATGVAVTNGDSVTISAVDKTNKTITVSGAGVTTDATHIVVREDTYGAAMTGLLDIVDDTVDIHGVTTSSYSRWKAHVKSSFGAFSVSKLQAEIDQVVINSGKFPTALFSDYTLQRKYFETLTANPRYTALTPPKVLDGGFRSLEYSAGSNPMPWIADRLMPAKTILGLHEPDLQVFTPGDWDFIDIGGDVWLPDIFGSSGKDQYKAVLNKDMELGCLNRNSHLKCTGVS